MKTANVPPPVMSTLGYSEQAETIDMTEEQFQSFIESSMAELQSKQNHLQEAFLLGEWPRWWFDQEREVIQFLDEHNSVAVEADTINIGSFAPSSNSWKWAWSNQSVLPALREKSERIKQLSDVTGIELFSFENPFDADEHMAWELAAMAVKQLQAEGLYRAPSSNGPHIFLALTAVRKVSSTH